MRRARLLFQVVVPAILCIALGSFLGCSPETRYKTLSFFFDGVPVPKGVEGDADAKGKVCQHKPYLENKCGACHPRDTVEMDISRPMDIGDLSSNLCLRCHDKVRAQYAVMHGPVASTECLLCHVPHESTIAHLLRTEAPRLCVQCHVPEVMVPLRPEHQDPKADCLSCHVGHGGPKHGLLREKRPATTRPSTRPAVALAAAPEPGAAR